MAKTITHEGVEYRKVKREAEVGELMYVISCADSPEIEFKIVECVEIYDSNDGDTSEHGDLVDVDSDYDEYYVLEPIEPDTPVEASPTVIELLANISRRLYEAEQTIKEQAYEINELYREVADRG